MVDIVSDIKNKIKIMKQYTDKLKQFNKAFGIEVDGTLDNPSILRFKLLEEENNEYLAAGSIYDIQDRRKEVLDAITDSLYIIAGTIVHHGLENDIEEAFDIVHQSNMSKLENGKPVVNGENGVFDRKKPVGKIIKGKDFKEPCFDNILNK